MRIVYNIHESPTPLIPHLPSSPRSTTPRHDTCFRSLQSDYVQEKVAVKPSQKKKHKRKRKYKELNRILEDLEGGNAYDLNLLAREGDGAYMNELESVTKGMTKEKLLGFMDCLDGHWCGRSERRKVVDAGEILKVLPIGWKIEIALRRRGEQTSLYCRSYVSPNGEQFKSCKDAAAYLRDQSLIDVAGPFQAGEMRPINDGSRMLLKSINEITSSTLHEANNNLLPGITDLHDVKIATRIDCYPCGLTFDDMDGLKKHLTIFHKKTTREFHLPKQPHASDKAQTTDRGQHAVVGYGEPLLGEPSSSSQKTAEVEEPGAIINGKESDGFWTECTWCNKEFYCEMVDAETMADATGFMCPECKEKLCGAFERSLSRAYHP